jgi:hypothetical protein
MLLYDKLMNYIIKQYYFMLASDYIIIIIVSLYRHIYVMPLSRSVTAGTVNYSHSTQSTNAFYLFDFE